MGHVEPGGAAGGPLERLPTARVWRVWRGWIGLLPVWRLPFEMITPGARAYFGSDFVTGLRRNRSSEQAIALAAPLSHQEFEQLDALVTLNQKRHEASSRFTLLVYLALPISGGLTLDQFAPGAMTAMNRPQVSAVVLGLLALLTLWALMHVGGVWRARQMAGLLEFARMEQGRRRRDHEDEPRSPGPGLV